MGAPTPFSQFAVYDGSVIRARYIAAGLIRPAAERIEVYLTPVVLADGPVLALDDRGRTVAARSIEIGHGDDRILFSTIVTNPRNPWMRRRQRVA